MPRQYGKHELQRVIDEAHRLALLNREDPPNVDDVLEAVGIVHEMNRPCQEGKPRSWNEKSGEHEKKENGDD